MASSLPLGVKKARGKNKFGAQITEVDGIKFHSKWEATRYRQLQLMVRAGAIDRLERQVPYRMVVNGVLICEYRADFVYRDIQRGIDLVVEDAKSPATAELAEYQLKKKLMLAIHGIAIQEVYKNGKKKQARRRSKSGASRVSP